MSDELADLLDEQEARHTGPAVAVRDMLGVISTLGRSIDDFGKASLEERSRVVDDMTLLDSIERAARTRRQLIEQSILHAASELAAKELRLADGSIRIESATPGYDTKDMSLRNALVQLIPLGDVTRAEVDDAIPEIVSCRPDHRKLNGLLKRGGRVQQAIEANRQRRPDDPMRMKVRVHRGSK